MASQAWNRSSSQGSQSADNCNLVISCGGLWPEDAGVSQQRNRVLRIAQKTFKGTVQERLVLGDGETDCAAKLLAREAVFYVLALNVWRRRIERLPGRERLADGERIGCIQGIVTEIAKEAAMNIIASGFGDDVDGRAAGAAEVRSVIAAVDLEFLHGILAHVQADAASIVIYFAAVHGNAVAAAIASVERKSALRRLLNAVILVRGEPSRIRDCRRQQRKGQVVAAVDGQVADRLLCYHVGLSASLSFDDWRLGRDFHLLRNLRHLQGKINRVGLANVDHHVLRQFRLEALLRHTQAVCCRLQPGEPVLAIIVSGHGVLNAFGNVGCRYVGIGNNGPGRIGHRSPDVA